MTTETNEDIYYPELAFFLNESLSDVVFVVDGHRLPAIKQTLSLKSRVFNAMFSGNFCESKAPEESKLPEIVVKDTTFDAFKTLIRFIYTEQMVFKDDNDLDHICDVYKLSDRYEVLRLRRSIGQLFESKINMKDLIPISKTVFTHNIEELMAKVMTFIELNINELIRREIEELKQLNKSTNDKLLDVLTGDHLDSNPELIRCKIGDESIMVKKEALLNKNATDQIIGLFPQNEYNLTNVKTKSFDAMKTFVGYLYFDKLIVKDQDDFRLIRHVCQMGKLHIKYTPFEECVANHLKTKITVETLEPISGIAFDYKLDSIMKSVNHFIDENITEIIVKNDLILRQINDSTDGYLLEVITEFGRKSLQK